MKHPAWVQAMAAVIKRQKWFRWHDAGDVQDQQHLNKIFEICRLTPDTNHWLPTREAWIKDHLASKPANLVIRFSPPMVGQRNDSWPNSSMVVETGATCPAPAQGGKCGSCRQCWDSSIKVVSYGKHLCGITQNIIKNYASVINRIRPLAVKKLSTLEIACALIRASSNKLQAFKLQATSFKPQATSIKLQAASDKLLNF